MTQQKGLLCSTRIFQRLFASQYVFRCPNAGLPEMTHISNEFQQFLVNTDFLHFGPLRSLDDSYGLAHMPIWRIQK